MPQVVPAHALETQVPTPEATMQTWPALHFTPLQGSAVHRPSTQCSPFIQVGHKGTQLPFEQYCELSHSRPKQGSVWHMPGLPTQIWPSAHPKVRHESSTH